MAFGGTGGCRAKVFHDFEEAALREIICFTLHC